MSIPLPRGTSKPQLDYQNPIARYCRYAFLPSEGSGNFLTEVVSGTAYEFTDGITWNSDGSVSSTVDATTTVTLPNAYSELFGSKSMIFMANVEIAPGGGSTKYVLFRLLSTNNNRAAFVVQVDNWSSLNLDVFLEVDNYGASHTRGNSNEDGAGNLTCIVHYDASTRIAKVYYNGQVVSTLDVFGEGGTFEQTISQTFFGLSKSTDKFFGFYLLLKDDSFTSDEISSIISDPYQIFERLDIAEQYVEEYGLKGDGISQHVVVDIPQPSSNTGGTSINDEFDFEISFSARNDANENFFVSPEFYIDTSGGLLISGIASVALPVSASADDLNTYRYIYKSPSGTSAKTISIYINDELLIDNQTSTAGRPSAITKLFDKGGSDYRAGTLGFFSLKNRVLPSDNRYYDFNRSPATTIAPELINGQNGTLVGFPAPSGYVTDDNGVVTGYVLNDASQSISYPLVGAWSGTITYSDNTTANVSGSDTYIIDGTTPVTITTFDVTDTNGNHIYDHTTGDTDQIIDTVSNNHATIVNVPTSGYMPIIDKNVFTQPDYASLASLQSAENASLNQTEYLNATSTGTTMSGFANGLILTGNTVSSALTVNTSGETVIRTSNLQDIDTSSQTGTTTLEDSEAVNVTG